MFVSIDCSRRSNTHFLCGVDGAEEAIHDQVEQGRRKSGWTCDSGGGNRSGSHAQIQARKGQLEGDEENKKRTQEKEMKGNMESVNCHSVVCLIDT